jgi:hypothetical protein
MPSKNELVVLRDQITDEVNRDAVVISKQLFGGNAESREPDLQRVNDAQLRGLYRQKYMEQDRTWLQNEARRDPIQFTKVARQIGVVLPGELPGMEPLPNSLPLGPVGVSGLPAPAGPQAPMQAPPMPAPADPMLAQAALPLAAGGVVAGVPQPGVPVLPPEF